jgi:hypothetical protein
MRVPLSYAPKQKFLARIQQRPDSDSRTVQVSLPRMSFEMIQLEYDPNRKIAPLQQSRAINSSISASTQYAPTPYNVIVYLYIYAKNQDDGLQIVEQILPYFNPDYNLTMKAIPELDIKNDLPIILDTVSFEDDYEGDLTTRRSIIWTMSFTMKLNFYGPITDQSIIRRVITNTYNNIPSDTILQKATVETNPNSANPTDNYDYLEIFEDF